MQRRHSFQHNQQTKTTQCMHAKNTMHAIDSILCMHYIFRCFFCVHALHMLHCVRQRGTDLVRFLSAATLFQCSARVGLHQPAIGKFSFYDGWKVCEIRRSTLVRDIKASALNKWSFKWTPVSASACVAGGRADN